MSANTPHFRFLDRAAYALPSLVKQLEGAAYETVITQEQRQVVGAIQSHTYNAAETIACGLAAVGQMLSFVANSPFELERHQRAGLGDLIKHLAVEMKYLHEVETDMLVRIDQSDKVAAVPSPESAARGKRGGSAPA